MTEEEFQKRLLGVARDAWIGEPSAFPPYEITLDGDFTLADLKKIIEAMQAYIAEVENADL